VEYAWWFNRMRPSDKAREPIQGEFFASEATSRPGEALVREAIQNSLDARLGKGPVVVRMHLSRDEGGVAPGQLTKFLVGLRDHLQASDSGLRDLPDLDGGCPFILLEDFRTTGLTGDPTAMWPQPASRNHFYHFFRAEGRTDKSGQDIGRWGVGKQALLRASRINSLFGYTVRHDDGKRLLMGMAVLRSHWVGSTRYLPDGWFCHPPDDPERQPAQPLEDEDVIAEFRDLFNVSRTDEAGLSVVIPWYESEITQENILCAVLSGYFWPILRGELEVRVSGPDGNVTIDSERFEEVLASAKWVGDELSALVRLAKRANELDEDELALASHGGRYRWRADSFPEEKLTELRQRYQGGRVVGIRVPFKVREKRTQPRDTFFDVFLHNDGSEQRRLPIYIRQGIIIPDVRQRARGVPRGLHALVLVQDAPAAAFVGDAENPAHTQWQKDSSNFKGKYVEGWKILDFIIRSPMELARLLGELEAKEDRMVLLDFFSIPPEAQPGADVKRERPDKEGPGPKPDVKGKGPKTRRPYVIQSTDGGFVVQADPSVPLDVPHCVRLRAAYHVRAGDPFKRYDQADFDFAHNIKAKLTGAKVVRNSKNIMLATITDPAFRIEMSGFDRRRDLRVEVTRAEDPDAG